MPSRNFSPKKYFQKAIKNWWILFAAMIIGGLIGTGLSFLVAPRFEAEAKISTSVDYTLLPELQDYEEDRMINDAGWVMLADTVLENVKTQAKKQGFVISYSEILETFTAERIDDLWTLRVVSNDPAKAAGLANLWVDEAFLQLNEAFAYALMANNRTVYIDTLNHCLTETADPKICRFENNDALKAEIDAQTILLSDDLALSRGLNHAARFTINNYAQVPDAPSYQTRGVMAFFGLVSGFAIGLATVWFYGRKK